MPFTTHGHWYGTDPMPADAPKDITQCGGPWSCNQCHTEALHPLGDADTSTIPTRGPAVLYIDTGRPRTFHQIDGDYWDPSGLSLRERRVCRALLTHALEKLDVLDKAEQMGLTIGKQAADRG